VRDAIHHLKTKAKKNACVYEVLFAPRHTLQSMCRVRCMRWKTKGDLAKCIYWACRAEEEGGGRGTQLSEILDFLLLDRDIGLDGLVEVFKVPKGRKHQVLSVYSKTEALVLPNVPSGRLYFIAQYTDALQTKDAGILTNLLMEGMVPHYLAPRILTDILSWDVTVLDNASILAIARHYQIQLVYDIIQRADKSALKEVRKPLVHAVAHSLLGTVAATLA